MSQFDKEFDPHVASLAKEIADRTQDLVSLTIAGTEIKVWPGATLDSIYTNWTWWRRSKEDARRKVVDQQAPRLPRLPGDRTSD